MKHRTTRVAVLGAGLQGSSVALALAHAGYAVTLLDRAPGPLYRSSLRNEGKIHLGFVYCNDPDRKTPPLMLRCALEFAPLLERWLGHALPWAEWRSAPFQYALMRESMVNLFDIQQAFHRLDADYRAMRDSSMSYLGVNPDRLCGEAIPVLEGSHFSCARVSHTITTSELALDLTPFCAAVRQILIHDQRIDGRYGVDVREVKRRHGGFEICGHTRDGAQWTTEAEVVVNCLWEGRLLVDDMLGYAPSRPHLHRLKYRLIGSMKKSVPGLMSCTLILGAFGDLVLNKSGRHYFSWHPGCMLESTNRIAPPDSWQAACDGVVTDEIRQKVTAAIMHGLGDVIPSVTSVQPLAVDAGVICAWGETDIVDPSSGLHRRHDIGVHEHDGYYSIDSGKFTCAPAFARDLVQLLK